MIYANRAARELFFGGRRLEGNAFAEIVGGCPEPLGRALAAGSDALAREILEAHGGRLELAARDGGGLAVTCRLPAP